MAKKLDPNTGLLVEEPGIADPTLAAANADLAGDTAYARLASATLANKSPDYMTDNELKNAYLQNPSRSDVNEKIRERGIDINSIYNNPAPTLPPTAGPTGPSGTSAAGGVKAPPTYKKPDTSVQDTAIAKYAPTYDPDAIDTAMNAELNAIATKWNIKRQQAKEETENERLSQISNLYGVGVVNPLSSGLASIGTASQGIQDKRLAAIGSQESAEQVAATQRAYGLKTTGQATALDFAKEQKAKVEKEAADDYARQRQDWNDSVAQVKDAAAAVKAGQTTDKETKDQAQENIKNILATGSASFEGVDAAELAAMEKAAGWPSGTLEKAIAAKKEQEMLNRKTYTTKDGIFVMEVGKDGVAKLKPLLKISKTTPTPEDKKSKNYSATNIPEDIKNDLLTDIGAGMPVEDAYSTYPEVSTTYIKTLYPTKKTPSSGNEEERKA